MASYLYPQWTGLLGQAERAFPLTALDESGWFAWAEQTTLQCREIAARDGFRGKPGQVTLVPEGERDVRALVGLDPEAPVFHLASPAQSLSNGVWRWDPAPTGFSADLIALAWASAAYRFTRYHRPDKDVPRLVAPEGTDVDLVTRQAEAVRLARDLINTPAEHMGPADLEEAARLLAERHGADLSVIRGDDLIEHKAPLTHAVGRASTRAPRLLDLSWGPEGAPTVTLVGKGVCFDTGGLNLKPSGGMRNMKKDMGGAAAALALAHMLMDARLEVRLRVLIPAVDNAVAGSAFKPGDVLTAADGTTIEITNTDAEGRLVLADALLIADADSPDVLIDFATLTGAARVGLGPDLPVLYASDDMLAEAITRGGEAVHDPVWRLPFWKRYKRMLDSKVADTLNAAETAHAGSITGALFLKRFVSKAKRYAHFDVYMWRDDKQPGQPAGAELQAARAVDAALRRLIESKALNG